MSLPVGKVLLSELQNMNPEKLNKKGYFFSLLKFFTKVSS
ncbi:hypothetical protein AB406_0435 [Riemerella anatipestifer]|uniref:Uncharacterized protein n=1 Tax=Riemerella anatipestifer TaxID=34085 RepID=A0A1S7DQJ9_RIEAN|nr:hypothetical protein AB406_0435 [Riemerella anatipestifer]